MENIKEAVIKALKRLKAEGKNLLGGYFEACNGNVLLHVSNHTEQEYSIHYDCYSVSYRFIINKSEV